MGKQQEEQNEENEKEEIFQVIKLNGRLFLKQNKQENMIIYISKYQNNQNMINYAKTIAI